MSTCEDHESDAYEDRAYESQHPEVLVCPSCGGDGWRQANYGLINWDGPRYEKCSVCNGSGIYDDSDERESEPEWRQADHL